MKNVNTKIVTRNVLTANADERIHIVDELKVVEHELKNSQINHKLISGTVMGVERLDKIGIIAIIDYKGVRVVIPSEFFFREKIDDGIAQEEKLISNMLGAEVDFIIRDISEGAYVGNRKEAMELKEKQFYVANEGEKPKIVENQVVQGRIVATSDYRVRFEVFGVETSIEARNMSKLWSNNTTDNYNVGDKMLVEVTKIDFIDGKVNINIKAIEEKISNIDFIKPQNKYIGEVVGVNEGTMFIALKVGVNAISHKSNDKRQVQKGDLVSFVCTRLGDKDDEVVVGVVTKVIRRNNNI